MPPSKESSMAGSADRISSLPEILLLHVMSFLQAQEAVGLCVLAQRWRHLWKSMRVLRITGDRPVQKSHKFLDHVIALRGHYPLNACWFHFSTFSGGDWRYVNLWIQYALACQVRVLDVSFRNGRSFPLPDLPLVSQTLTQLKLHYLRLNDKFLDFSSCHALEDLNMTKCSIPAGKISSRSLKRLSILECCFTRDIRTRISVPGLVSLQLIAVDGRTPLIEDMAVLVTAAVRLDDNCKDSHGYLSPTACGDPSCECCNGTDRGICDDFSCECCYGDEDQSAGCVLLEGFSAATSLKMIAEPEVFILRRDLRWCPTFSKLKTLVLNEGCVAADHHALICILQHSPVLENLTVQLSKKHTHMATRRATYNLLEQSFASENLKIVEIVCQKVDQRVNNIMKSLSTYGIPLEKMKISQTNKSSECFNFVCTGFSSKQWREDQDQ